MDVGPETEGDGFGSVELADDAQFTVNSGQRGSLRGSDERAVNVGECCVDFGAEGAKLPHRGPFEGDAEGEGLSNHASYGEVKTERARVAFEFAEEFESVFELGADFADSAFPWVTSGKLRGLRGPIFVGKCGNVCNHFGNRSGPVAGI